jgi:uncharacterized protein YajQ (UPF0234 family)
MANDPSYDVVSNVDLHELNNATDQTQKEIAQRYDFKNSKSKLTLNKDELEIITEDEYKLAAVIDILQNKLIRRGVPIKNLAYGKIEPAANAMIRQIIKVKQGIETETAKKITKAVKDSKLKVQTQITGDSIRISSKSKDALQESMQLIRELELEIDLQFTNYR